jgi:hypothetical protein
MAYVHDEKSFPVPTLYDRIRKSLQDPLDGMRLLRSQMLSCLLKTHFCMLAVSTTSRAPYEKRHWSPAVHARWLFRRNAQQKGAQMLRSDARFTYDNGR